VIRWNSASSRTSQNITAINRKLNSKDDEIQLSVVDTDIIARFQVQQLGPTRRCSCLNLSLIASRLVFLDLLSFAVSVLN